MIEYLSGFMLPGREKVLRETLANRTRYMTICLENTYHPCLLYTSPSPRD